MTENTTATNDDDAAGTPEETTPAAPVTRQDGRDERTREKLRDTETRLAAAQARTVRLAEREVTRLLSEYLEGGQDILRLAGRDALSFLDEDGDVDEEAVRDFAAQAAQDRPYLRKVPHHADLGTRGLTPVRAAGWGDVLAGRRR